MELAKKYNPTDAEKKWYSHWLEKGYFNSTTDERESYTIVIPPPNVTGVLHMGHMLNNTLQDVLVRRARMMGYNACWVPGTDHASIATEAKVVQKLAKEGIKKSDLTRDEFLAHAFDWKEKHGGIILEQLKKLGASCDWNRTKFTMDDDMSESVIKVFVDLHQKGLIYRGVRMVNWDPSAQTALSDEEVIHKEVNSKLYHIAYNIEGSDEKLTIATTRPETILGDSAICVNPNDKRYMHLKGKKAIIPLVDRVIPIIFDEYVDIEFGTGALKITPAHDINDYQLGDKHGLETIEILNDDGTLNESAELYIGKDRFDVREEITADLEKDGFLVKTEEYQNKVGFSERTDAVIEPKLSMQWFCKMEEFSKPALEHVMNDDIQFHPAKFKNTYRHWIENIKDWCVSRQLWWGQQIPAYFYEGNKYVVAESKEEALVLAQKEKPSVTIADLRQDADVLDTWFSSWLWPMSVFDGIRNPDNEEINYYYPTNDLVTAPEILFFWVARMIMAGYEYKGELPFENVYLTGIVRDKQGRKMSKSLGNSPDPIELIQKYGADGVRVGMLLCSPAGNDLPFDEGLCEQGRNFSNKIWNAFRLIKGWEVADVDQPNSAEQAIIWFENRINKAISEIDESYRKYRISEALMTTYKLVWDDFCSWYLEMVKPTYGSQIDSVTYNKTIEQLEKTLKLLHPFMPFLSEEVWHLIDDRKEDIIVAEWPKAAEVDDIILDDFDIVSEVVSSIRNFRKEKQIANKEQISLFVKENESHCRDMDAIICKLGNIEQVEYTTEKVDGAFGFRVRSNEYFIPLEGNVDIEAEIAKLQKELDYTRGFLKSVNGKLSNERFVSGAPEQVVANERKKQSDAMQKIEVLENQIASLT
ncbi:MAG TPA: valine--tRNA ligase [Flavobacteriales bacterium]|jgi:valyl-tRNA synthetase|nr:valine--tRNA ligase [Flavobacteriales bacterium]|tara:strand:+ start:5272 stop:7881 length:2610 start_codon:yes stop_codon:yes gene_type:complete